MHEGIEPWIHPGRVVAGLSIDLVRFLKASPRSQTALAAENLFRLLGSLRRECLDFLISFGEAHLRRVLRIWQNHYNRARAHSQLGPGLPQPPPGLSAATIIGHALPRDKRIMVRPILGGLHQEYGLERLAA